MNSRRSSARRPTLLAVQVGGSLPSLPISSAGGSSALQVVVPNSQSQSVNTKGSVYLIDRDIFARAKAHVQRVLSLSLFASFLGSPAYAMLLRLRTIALQPCSADDFVFVRLLGEGGFGRVFAVLKRDTRAMYACKTMNKMGILQKKRERLICNERDVLAVVRGLE